MVDEALEPGLLPARKKKYKTELLVVFTFIK
jgi:hypothetical protein